MGLSPWLRLLVIFLTFIAGTVAAVIVWLVVQRFLHLLLLLTASFLVAYLLTPMVERLRHLGLGRVLSNLAVYLVVLGVLAGGLMLLVGPLTAQVQGLVAQLPLLMEGKVGAPALLDQFFHQHGIKLTAAGLRTQLAGYLSGAGTTLLNQVLAILTSVVGAVTDVLLVLAITFYFLLDGHAMQARVLRLLPSAARSRWFYLEAIVNKVLGGYFRGQFIVAATVGMAAGVGCWLLGLHDYLIVAVLAFLCEFIPMLGPVLGMVPAMVLSLFQSLSLLLWVTIFFIALQQVESNVIVPRVSGRAVGLHPLAALLALLVGVELGGLGGALVAVPVAGVLWALLLTLYGEHAEQARGGDDSPRRAPPSSAERAAGPGGRIGTAGTEREASPTKPLAVPSHRLEEIKEEQQHLIEAFEADVGPRETDEPAPRG
jgi:predicted PurR-regulated permease PerM